MKNMINEQISALRSIMQREGWDAVVVPGSDPHNSEYLPARWQQRQFISGFTGSYGTVIITPDHAGLWTDTRYFIQAVRQLEGTGFVLHKTRVPEQVLIPEWLRTNLDRDAIIAVDGLCQSASAISAISDDFTVVSIPNMLDRLWSDRPGIPQTPIFAVNSGESRSSKLEWLRSFMKGKGCNAILLSALDEIAWTLNVRASDIEYNPLVISYLLVTEDKVRWFVLKDNVEDPDTLATFDILRSEGVALLPYSEIELYLGENVEGRLFLDSESVNYHLWSIVDADVVFEPSPVQLRKAVKNDFELDGMRKAHFNDGLVMERFLYWLEKSVASSAGINEWDASMKLVQLRSEVEG